MVTWFAFPEQSGVTLKFRRHEGKLHYILNLQARRGAFPAELAAKGWQPLPDNPRILTRPFPAAGAGGNVIPLNFFSRMQAHRRTFNLDSPEGKTKFFDLHGLSDCPEEARVIGVNRDGDEIYTHNDHRWIGGRAWTNHESLYPPALALRFTRREDFLQLARTIIEDCLQSGKRFDREELNQIARATVASCPSRPNRQLLTADEEQAGKWLMADLYLQICQSPIHGDCESI